MAFQWFGDKFKGFIDDKIEGHALACGSRMQATAQRLAPVDTGELRNSIYFTYDKSTKELRLHADAPHSLYVEYGTYKMAPHPYMRPALLQEGPSFFSGVRTGFSMSTSLRKDHIPRQIMPRIRPRIAAANRKFNVKQVRKTQLSVIHLRESKIRLSPTGRHIHSPHKSNLSRIHKHKGAWN